MGKSRQEYFDYCQEQMNQDPEYQEWLDEQNQPHEEPEDIDDTRMVSGLRQGKSD